MIAKFEFGTLPSTLPRIESYLEGVVAESSSQLVNTTDHRVKLLDNHNQQLDNVADQQNVQKQILTAIPGVRKGSFGQYLKFSFWLKHA